MPPLRKISSRAPFFCALVIVALCPIPSTDAPEWDVTVVDQAGQPASKVLVVESYQNYSAEFEGHQEEQFSNAGGHAHFAAKWIFAPAIVRLGVTALSALGGAHASFGPYSYVTAFSGADRGDDERDGRSYAWQGSPARETSRLILSSH